MATPERPGGIVRGWLHFYPPFVRERAAIGLLIIRVMAGAALVLHGLPKLQHPFSWMPPEAHTPSLLQALAVLAEFGGGLALIIGVLTPIAAIGLFFNFLVAILNTHLPAGDPFVAASEGPSYELAALYLAVAAMLLFTGPGAFSLDAMLWEPKRRQL